MTNRQFIVSLVAGVALLIAGSAQQAQAKVFKPAQPTVAAPAPADLMPTPATPGANDKAESSCCCTPKCCPTPCVTYRHIGRPVRCCGCCECPKEICLTATNPCTCCPVNVPVCLPGCCKGAPCVTCRDPLLGEGLVKYKWCCGVTVTVRFLRCGNVHVTYHHA